MKLRLSILTLALAVLAAACTPQAAAPTTAPQENPSATAPAAPEATPTALPTAAPVTLPSATPPPEPTHTSLVPAATQAQIAPAPGVTPLEADVNCRYGPGLDYETVGALKTGESAAAIGLSADHAWIQIQLPGSTNKCWVAAGAATVTGDLGIVPAVEPPLTFVDAVTVEAPPRLSVPGCSGPFPPIKLKGTIQVNGPSRVTWRFETQQSGRLSVFNSSFPAAGTYTVSMDYTPPLAAGTHWVNLIVFSPNTITGRGNYQIACP